MGEKRLRDDDDSENQRDGRNGGADIKSEASPPPGQNGNDAYNGQTNSGNPTAGSGVVGAAGAGGGQHDALYIGDLQWVCTLSMLISSHVCCISETIFICDARHPVPLCCFLPFHSGRLMRTCGKLRRTWESTLTTRTSLSRSIR